MLYSCFCVSVGLLMSSLSGWATSVGVMAIEQPVNLCERSDPTRIPLGRVGVECNYDYGAHAYITAARPCPEGAMEWKGGSELDQNLANVFGISVEPEDHTMILHGPCVIRVKAWNKPAYSPYTKEQAVAATLWCAIRSSRATEERPLIVKVVAESDDDKGLEKRFSGKYALNFDKDRNVIGYPDVPGTRLEKDPRGFTWVVFPEAKPAKDFKPLEPVMIPMELGGESGDSGWQMTPVWGNGKLKEPLELAKWNIHVVYTNFYSRGVCNANAFSEGGGAYSLRVLRGDLMDEVEVIYPGVGPSLMAASVLGLVLTMQPTEDKPMRVTIALFENQMESYAKWVDEAGWKKQVIQVGGSDRLTIHHEFVWDAKQSKLVKGAVPELKVEKEGWVPMN